MDEIEIEKWVKVLKIPNFLGCFPVDMLPPVPLTPSCLILNHDKHNEPGSHWVAIILHNHNNTEYFDSLGDLPPNEVFHWRNITSVNRRPVQNLFADTCGHHCLYYLYARLCQKKNREQLLASYKTKPDSDTFVKKFLQHF